MKILSLSFTCFLLLASFACQSTTEEKTESRLNPAPSVQPSIAETPIRRGNLAIAVPELAGRSIEEIDKTFGTPDESKSIEKGGVYRLYLNAYPPKGLAVRFYGGKAQSFNLILGKPAATSKEALTESFGIDVGGAAPLKDAKEPLTESYRGTFGGVKFKKVSAKRQESGKGFIFVLAEVAE